MQYMPLQQGRIMHSEIDARMHGEAHRALNEEVQGEDAYACGQKAPPKD